MLRLYFKIFKRKYYIKGLGSVLFSTYSKEDNNYYNGFQFIRLDSEFDEIFKKILKIIKELKNK